MLTDPSIASGEIAPGPSHLTAGEEVSRGFARMKKGRTEFVCPILNERGGTGYDSFVDRSFAGDGRLLEQRPE